MLKYRAPRARQRDRSLELRIRLCSEVATAPVADAIHVSVKQSSRVEYLVLLALDEELDVWVI